MKKIFGILLLMTIAALAFADKPEFFEHPRGYYFARYIGTVRKIYVNANNLILVYFDTPIVLSEAIEYGLYYGAEVTQSKAGIIKIDDQPEFAKLFYATALEAQSLGKRITIQMRGVHKAYVIIDKIWLAE